jgi:hypothetical protein
MTINSKVLDDLLADYKKPEDVIGENGLLKQLTKALLERALQTELTGHLGYEKHDPAGHKSGNSRNGTSRKKLKGDFGEMELETPRDRNGSFEPKIVERHQTRWTGFDDKILSMYSSRDVDAGDSGTSGRDLQNRSEPCADLGCDERGTGGSTGLAAAIAGIAIPHRLYGRTVRQDAR